jgi:hypothetical protein
MAAYLYCKHQQYTCKNPIASFEDDKNIEHNSSKNFEEKARISFRFSSANSLV